MVEHGIKVVHTGYSSSPTIELTLALILASVRNVVAENASLRGGGWQRFIGDDLAGRILDDERCRGDLVSSACEWDA